MIRLQKGPEPAWLTVNRAQKTADYKNAPRGSKPTPWRAAEIVLALKEECSKKCIYCESTIDDAAYSAVEHIRPKSLFEDLVLEWDNLGLVCPRCNTNKGDYWTDDSALQLIDPYHDVPMEHLEFRGPLTVAKLNSLRGENTVSRLKLHREDLLISRLRRIEELHVRLALWHRENDPERKELYAEDVRDAIAADREYAGVLRAYAHEFGFPSEGF
jgi:uncharacterized protein (TIGR02646 family)